MITSGLTQLEHLSARRLRHGEEAGNQESELAVMAIPLYFAKDSNEDYWSIQGLFLQKSVKRVGCFD